MPQAAPGVVPDSTTFQTLLTVLQHAGDWQQALVVYEVMSARVRMWFAEGVASQGFLVCRALSPIFYSISN